MLARPAVPDAPPTPDAPLAADPPASAPPVVASDADRLAAEPPTVCLNCGAALPGEFCPDCGQRDQPLRQPAHVFIAESVSEYFGLDGRLWRTLRLLLFSPGALTAAYLDGQRARYLRPLRIYLTATLAFFFILAQQDPIGSSGGQEVVLAPVAADTSLTAEDLEDVLETREAAAGAAHAAVRSAYAQLGGIAAGEPLRVLADSFAARETRLGLLADRMNRLRDDSLVAVASLPAFAVQAVADTGRVETILEFQLENSPLDNVPEWAKGSTMRQIESSESPVERELLMNQYLGSVLRQVPTALILILPVFALLLKLFYVVGTGRSPRLQPRPTPVGVSAPWWKRVNSFLALARWQVGNWRGRWRRHRRRRRAAKRQRRFRGAPARLYHHVRQHSFLRPWRVRKTRQLRRELRSPRSRYYAEHLVFALHVHAYTFIILAILLVIGLPWSTTNIWMLVVSSMLLLSIPLYFLIAQRRVYGLGWAITIVKATFLGLIYTILISFGTLIAAGLALRLS